VPRHQENRIVNMSVEHLNSVPSYRTTEPAPSLRLQQLIDHGTVYVAQNLSPSQFATLQAIAALIRQPKSKYLAARLDASLSLCADCADEALHFAPLPALAFDYQLGLDELDTITRTRTGYAFAELPAELQDAILSLISTRDLTTGKLDLALWLEDLHSSAAAL
jgi:hypothetical protein